MSKKYESGSSGPGTIANNSGDWGGASYGTYQIATNTGTMKSFLNYLKSADRSTYNKLSRFSPGSSGFNNAWKSLAKSNSKGFDALQHGFIKKTHYDPVVRNIGKSLGIKESSLHHAVRNVIWSTGVQHGAFGAGNILKRAGIRNGMSPAEMIRRIYNERSANGGRKYFPSSSSAIRESVVNRFKREMQDALNMLGL